MAKKPSLYLSGATSLGQKVFVSLRAFVGAWSTQTGVWGMPNHTQSSKEVWQTFEVLNHRSAKSPAVLRDLRPSNHLFLLSSSNQPPSTCVREPSEVPLPSSITKAGKWIVVQEKGRVIKTTDKLASNLSPEASALFHERSKCSDFVI